MYDDTYVDEVARKAQPATEVPSASTSPSRSIWLRGIGEAHVESALWEAFESCGEIDGVNIYGAKHVAFVHFMSEDAGRSALEKAINDPICGTKLQVNSAKATAPPPRPMGRLGDGVNPSNILLIHDLPRSVNDTHVFAVLKHFHGLMKVSPLPETTTVSVHFRTVPDATVCRNTLHGRTVCGATVSVQYAKHSIPVGREQESPTAYDVGRNLHPVDYYEFVESPDCLKEREVEDFINVIRELSPDAPATLQKGVTWMMRRTHKIKDIVRLLEVRARDIYLEDQGKRLLILYMYFSFLKTVFDDGEYDDVYKMLAKSGLTRSITKLMCYKQARPACDHISNVFSTMKEGGVVDESEFMALHAYIRNDAELQALRRACGFGFASGLPPMDAMMWGKGGKGIPGGMPDFGMKGGKGMWGKGMRGSGGPNSRQVALYDSSSSDSSDTSSSSSSRDRRRKKRKRK